MLAGWQRQGTPLFSWALILHCKQLGERGLLGFAFLDRSSYTVNIMGNIY